MKMPTTTIFSRLLSYFIVVMLIPLLILIISYFYYSQNNIKRIVANQTETAIEKDVGNLNAILDKYRHIAYVLSEDIEIVNALENDSVSSDDVKSIYSLLFSEIGADNAKAQASIISSSGRVQLSTDNIPQTYDLRIYNNAWDSSNILSRTMLSETKENQRDVYISIADHRTTFSGKLILATMVRRVISKDGNTVGFVIIDIYSDEIISSINTSSIFQEELLVDNTSYIAISLLHTSLFGSFSNFPNLYGENLLTVEKEIPSTNFSLIANTDIRPYQTNISSSMVFLAISISIGFAIAVALALVFSNSFAKRAKLLTDTMSKIEEGKLDERSQQNTGIKEFNQLATAFNNMTAELSSLLELTREEEAKLAEAERKELENQLNPHFLFNTLNTIKALARLHGEDEIYTISIRLGKILRSSLNNRESECSLKDSIELVESYLMIQKIRFKDKISYTLDIDESVLGISTPKLIIQPLVENAIIHGLEPMTGSGEISVKIKDADDLVDICVTDNGVGFNPPSRIEDLKDEGHIGIYNVYRRLSLHYKETLSFSILSQIGEGTRIAISFPKDGNK